MTELISLWQAMVLGIIQGLTEFLPVSSSGHLALAESFLAVPGGGVAFAVLLHAGTLVAIGLVFPRGIRDLVVGAFGLLRSLGRPPSAWDEATLLTAKVACATVPGAVVGLALNRHIEGAFANTDAVGALLIVTSGFLLATRWIPAGNGPITWRDAWLIGLAQAFAILPGISRSGATITLALALGVARPRAAEFSFLVAVPLILGSLVLQTPNLIASTSSGGVDALAAGFLTSFLVGWAALAWLVRLVRNGRLHWFSLYCLVVGLTAILGPRFL